MEELVGNNQLLINLGLLIVSLLRHLMSEGGASFYFSLVAGGVLAFVFCFFVRLVVINVNRDYKASIGFIVSCFLISCTTFFSVVMIVSLQYAEPVVREAIQRWESSLRDDNVWNNASFREAYEAVYELKDNNGNQLENFTKFPHPDKGGKIIPMNSDVSKLRAISIYLDRSVKHFDKKMPLISWILWANSGMAKENIFKDMQQVFATNPVYQMADAISIAGKEIGKVLSAQTKRIIWFGRVITLALFAVIQIVIIGLLAFSAYREIKENL